MKTSFSYPVEVEKEKVSGLRFPVDEVLPSGELQKNRKSDLYRALDYGNYALYKVAIVFEDDCGIKKVETTIWDVDDTNVYLKNRLNIPIHRILEVKL
jgi:uncharacterized protein (UPF0248 family)